MRGAFYLNIFYIYNMKAFENELVKRFFPNKSFEKTFRLNGLFNFLLFPFLFFILPIIISFIYKMGMDSLFFVQFLGAGFGILIFPFSMYSLTLLILSYFINYEKISFNNNILYFLYFIWIGYISSTLADEYAGGFLMTWWFDIFYFIQ